MPRNACYQLEGTEKTWKALRQINDPALYERHIINGYGHLDCIFGKHPDRDVYPVIQAALDAHNA